MKEQISADKQLIATIFVKYEQAKLTLANNMEWQHFLGLFFDRHLCLILNWS